MAKEKNNEKVDKAGEDTQAEDIHLTLYTASTMIGVLISAVTTVLAFIMVAKTDFYIVKSQFGGLYDDDTLDLVKSFVFNSEETSRLTTYSVIIAVLCVLTSILTLVVVIKSIDPLKKPAFCLSLIALTMAVAAMVVDILLRVYYMGIIDTYVSEFEGAFDTDGMLAMNDFSFIAVIINTIGILFMVIGVAVGKKKWKETGKTF